MAKTAVRQVSIFLNNKQVENSIKSIAAEQRKMNNELAGMIRGTDEYEKKATELRKVNGILADHRKSLNGIQQGWSLAKVGVDKFVGIAAGAFAVDSIIGYGKQLFNTGVQMEAMAKKARTVFGEALPLITSEAEKNARAMGLTNAQYIAAAANIQDLLVPMGFQRKEAANISAQLLNLSGALSEWTGGQRTAAEVSHILNKALLGEREELKSLGIAISEADVKAALAAKGLDKLTGSTLEQAKATATLELILNKSKDAQAQFAEGSDSAVRRQAELSAKISEITEKLATLLLPIFERLVSIASSVVGVFENIVGGIESIIEPAESATKAFDEQAKTVGDLETNILPLLDRYDQLAGKTTLNAEEQDELQKIITTVAGVIPTAISGFDAYGKALGLNTDKAREFIEVERARLKFINQEAIRENERFVTETQKQLDIALAKLRSGTAAKTRPSTTGFGAVTEFTALTGSEIQQLQAEASQLQETLKGANAEVSRLKGDTLAVQQTVAPAPAKAPGAPGSPDKKKTEEAGETEEALLARLRAVRESFDAIQKIETEQEEKRAAAFLERQNAELEAYNEKNLKKLDLDLNYEAEKAAALEEVRVSLLTEQEVEIEALTEHYNRLLFLAEQYGADTSELKAQFAKEQADIEKKYATEAAQEQYEIQQARLAALQSAFTAFGDFVVATFDLLGGEGEKASAFQKIATLAKIAFDTAAAISSLVAASEANPANAFTFGAAGIAQYVTGIVRILTNIGQAKKLLSGAPKVQQKGEGSYLDVAGAQDGRTYRARSIAPPSTGLLPSYPVLFQSQATGSPVLASERGREYFVASDDLRNPAVANHVRMIELITRGAVAQFAEGGANPPATPPAAPAPAQDLSMLRDLTQAVTTLNNLLGKGIIAVIPDGTVVDINKRFNTINTQSGGYFG